MAVQIPPAVSHHCRCHHHQPDEKSHAQRYNRQNCSISAEALPNFPICCFPHRRFSSFHVSSPSAAPRHKPLFLTIECLQSAPSILYHSICSTGTICSFLRISVTVPFFTVIIRSAIAVIAWLCVMTTTVTPFLRQVSCSSFSTALPVL